MQHLIPIILSIVITIFNATVFMVIKFNDLKHLEMSVKDLKTTVQKNSDKIDSIGERLSKLEGIVHTFKRLRNKK